MNILVIKVPNPYDNDLQEFIFRTNRPVRDFYDCNFNLTKFLQDWLAKNKPSFYKDLMEYGLDEIQYYREDSLDEIV